MGPLEAFGIALAVILLAEFGDKSQIALVALASRGHPWRTLAGAAAAFAVLTAAAVAVGAVAGGLLPSTAIALGSGLLFLAIGAWTLASREGIRLGGAGAFLTILVAEMGDKTQVAILGLAVRGHPVAVGLGAFIAETLLAVVAVLAGAWLAGRVPERALRIAAGIAFLAVGAWFVAAALVPLLR